MMMIIHKSEEEELTLEHALDKLGHTSNFDVHGEVISLLADLYDTEFKRRKIMVRCTTQVFIPYPAPMLCLGITPSNETNQ
jgi:hypothetical protein